MKSAKTIHTNAQNDSHPASITQMLIQNVLKAREVYEHRMDEMPQSESGAPNLQRLIDQESALVDVRAAEEHLTAHIRDLRALADALKSSGDAAKVAAFIAEAEQAERVLKDRRQEDADEAFERLRIISQAVTGGRRSSEDSTDILRRWRSGESANE